MQLSLRDTLELRLAAAAGDQVSGAHSGGVPPVPIPNTAVKPTSADGSRTAGSLESRSVPDFYKEARQAAMPAGFFIVPDSWRGVERSCMRWKPTLHAEPERNLLQNVSEVSLLARYSATHVY